MHQHHAGKGAQQQVAHLNGTVPSQATWTPSKRMMTSSGFSSLAALAVGQMDRTSTPFCSGAIPYEALPGSNRCIRQKGKQMQ